jgi:uncharacterized membrane protein
MIDKVAMKRDPGSSAVVNTDVNALNKYKQERELHRKINKLMAECGEVKQCLENVNARLDKIENQINVKT